MFKYIWIKKLRFFILKNFLIKYSMYIYLYYNVQNMLNILNSYT